MLSKDLKYLVPPVTLQFLPVVFAELFPHCMSVYIQRNTLKIYIYIYICMCVCVCVTAIDSFVKVLNFRERGAYIFSTDRLFRCITTFQCG